MTVLIILVFLSLASIGAAFWFLKNDRQSGKNSLSKALDPAKDTSNAPLEEEVPDPAVPGTKSRSNILKRLIDLKKKNVEPAAPDTDEPTDIPSKPKISLNFLTDILKKFNLTDILKKINLGKKDPEPDDIPETTPLPSLKEYTEEEKENTLANEPETGTASIKTVPAKDPVQEKPLPETEEKKDEKEPALSSQLKELQEKYEKLDALFNEKSAELQKTKESLDNEIKNRKEFDKIKDLMEKEIKDSRDRIHNVQVEGENAKSEIERHGKRAAQLEEKVTQLKKDLLEKEEVAMTSKEEPVSEPAPEPPPIPEEAAPLEERPDETKAFEKPAEEGEDVSSGETPLETESRQNQDPTQMDGPFEAEPPKLYDEPSEDEPQPEKSFLKLQPDVISDESFESAEEEISKIVDPQQEPGSPPDDQEKNSENNDNTKE